MLCLLVLGLVFLLLSASNAPAQTSTNGMVPFRISIDASNQPQDLDIGIKILAAITLLSLAPSIILLTTCFTRIAIVLSFVRTALQLQGAPANQIIIGLSLFLTFFIMAPTWNSIQTDAIAPYQASQITSAEALDRASGHVRNFMLRQTRPRDVELFVSLAKLGPTPPDQLPLRVVIPSFIISELRTAFQMGFLLFVPFILIDLVVATVLMSMGMMMMPPATIAMPLKILLFVLVDGWELVVRSLIRSFGT
jgi:flagellar biosynthetic protein FliP